MRCVFPYDHVAAPVDPGAIVHQGCWAGNEAARRPACRGGAGEGPGRSEAASGAGVGVAGVRVVASDCAPMGVAVDTLGEQARGDAGQLRVGAMVD